MCIARLCSWHELPPITGSGSIADVLSRADGHIKFVTQYVNCITKSRQPLSFNRVKNMPFPFVTNSSTYTLETLSEEYLVTEHAKICLAFLGKGFRTKKR